MSYQNRVRVRWERECKQQTTCQRANDPAGLSERGSGGVSSVQSVNHRFQYPQTVASIRCYLHKLREDLGARQGWGERASTTHYYALFIASNGCIPDTCSTCRHKPTEPNTSPPTEHLTHLLKECPYSIAMWNAMEITLTQLGIDVTVPMQELRSSLFAMASGFILNPPSNTPINEAPQPMSWEEQANALANPQTQKKSKSRHNHHLSLWALIHSMTLKTIWNCRCECVFHSPGEPLPPSPLKRFLFFLNSYIITERSVGPSRRSFPLDIWNPLLTAQCTPTLSVKFLKETTFKETFVNQIMSCAPPTLPATQHDS